MMTVNLVMADINKSWQHSVNVVVNSVTIYFNLTELTSVITLLGLWGHSGPMNHLGWQNCPDRADSSANILQEQKKSAAFLIKPRRDHMSRRAAGRCSGTSRGIFPARFHVPTSFGGNLLRGAELWGGGGPPGPRQLQKYLEVITSWGFLAGVLVTSVVMHTSYLWVEVLINCCLAIFSPSPWQRSLRASSHLYFLPKVSQRYSVSVYSSFAWAAAFLSRFASFYFSPHLTIHL